MPLHISMKVGERMFINDDTIVELEEVRGKSIRLAVTAPNTVNVYREEVYRRIQAEKRVADAPHDYVRSQFSGPLPVKVPFLAPVAGVLKCCQCGREAPFKAIPYELQAACPDDDCIGQMFCNKWQGWFDK